MYLGFWNEKNCLWKFFIEFKWFGRDIHDHTIIENNNFGTSLWKSIMQCNNSFLNCSKWVIGKGNKVAFLEDVWCGNENFPS